MKKVLGVLLVFCLLAAISLLPACQGKKGEEEEDEEEASPTVTLGIRNVQSCSAINTETGEYTIQPGSTFDRGDIVWLYFEVPGITVKGVEGKFEFWAKFTELKLFDPNGDIVANVLDLGEIHEVDSDEPITFVWFYAWLESTSDDPVGQYRWEFTVEDGLSEATGTGSATFSLK